MSKRNEIDIQAKISEIERLVNEFKEKIEAGTASSDEFITMSEIERLWGELRNNTNNIYSDMVQELMSSFDERDLIRKKKENTETEE
jgi:hypothetical protein